MANEAPPPLITLTTDFGIEDNFVGVMKGVIAGIAPTARVVDLCHAVPPQDIHGGAFVLLTGFEFFPPGTVHLAIVDPGVGSDRRAIALAAGGYTWVAPDNGLLGYALAALAAAGRLGGRWDDGWWLLADDAVAVALAESRYWRPTVSRTFHGRDVFAPVAAALAAGEPLEAVGEPLDPGGLVALRLPEAVVRTDGLATHVLHSDRFGNAILDALPAQLERAGIGAGDAVAVRAGGGGAHALEARYGATFADVQEGALVVYVDGLGMLALAVNGGSAMERLGLTRDDELLLARR